MKSLIRCTVRLSSYQLLIITVGCAFLSFRAGSIILVVHIKYQQHVEVQSPDQCVDKNLTASIAAKNLTASIAAIVGKETKCNIPLSKNTPSDNIDKYTYNTADIVSVERFHEIRHHHYQRRLISSWSQNGPVLQRDQNDSPSLEFLEAMVHPPLLIHPNPYRIVILNDIGGQILQQVLKHKLVQEVKYVLPESFKEELCLANLTDSRVVVVYTNDLVTYFHHSAPIDALFMDATTYLNVTDQTFVSAVDGALGECGLLVCHTGRAESMKNLPASFLKSVRNDNSSNRWVTFIDALHQSSDFQNIVDYNEKNEKIVVGMKCPQCRANWIWNTAAIQIQIAKRMSTADHLFDGPTMASYQAPSRIAEEVWCRGQSEIGSVHDNDDTSTNRSSCKGHGFDPEIINYPASAFVVNSSLVANGGRGVFTTQPIARGSTIFMDDCVNGMIIPITTLNLIESAAYTMENISDFWNVFTFGYVYGYGWQVGFLGGPDEVGGVDTSISTFINHGCRGSYNIGEQYDYHEMNFVDCNPEKSCATCSIKKFKIYDPFMERQYSMWECPKATANRDIERGEEILIDYMCLFDTPNMLEEIITLQHVCNGGVGVVSEYERDVFVTPTD